MTDFIYPDWPAPSNVKSVMTTRQGGHSLPPYDSLNLGTHVGDNLATVQSNRALLSQRLNLPEGPLWLNQVHGTVIADHDHFKQGDDADAVVSHQRDKVCVIMTADCLPVLFCNKRGDVVAGAHAGWRGLQAGVLEKCVKKMDCSPETIMVWLGAAISQRNFEVGNEVREAFLSVHESAETAFIKNPMNETKWLADIYSLARTHLVSAGIASESIYGGGACTYEESNRFYSYRRESQTGRMACLIWLT